MKVFLLSLMLLIAGSAQAVACSSKDPERFDIFLKRFSSEKSFALDRTILPLRKLQWEYGIDEEWKDESAPRKSTITRAEYSQWPTLDSYMKESGLVSSIASQSRTAVALKIVKDGTDWQTLHHFKLKKGCWFFWQFEDQSL